MSTLWLADPAPRRAALEGERSCDVAIVGGGVAGVASAYFLARRGASVALVERGPLGIGATGRNAGFLLAGVAENFVAASRRYGDATAERVWRVTLRNQELVREIVARHAIACDLEWNGSMQIAGDDEEWTEMLASTVALLRLGFRIEVDEASQCTFVPTDGAVHPIRLLRGLARAAEDAGALIFEDTEATSVASQRVEARGGTLRASAVVVCTNAYAPHLVDARIRPVRGQILATVPLAERMLLRPVYAQRGYRYWRQTPDRRVVVGGWRDAAVDEEVGEEERLNAKIQALLDAFLRDAGISAAVTHRWAGIMGFSHDGLPYVGRLPSGVFVNAGFTGHGMGFALATGELAASLVCGETPPAAALFAPDRP
jgi:glycine/D-amino acid oxidase-like deaminating enzyme